MMKTLLLVCLISPAAALAYVPACLEKGTTHAITCDGTHEVDGRVLELHATLVEKVYLQNPEALPDKVCKDIGIPKSSFVLYINDLTTNRLMGFFSKFGTGTSGSQGEKPDMNVVLAGQDLNLKIYAFDYGDLTGNEDAVVKRTGPNTAEVKLSLDLLEKRTGERVYPISTTLSCRID